jgi:hypothetical protein
MKQKPIEPIGLPTHFTCITYAQAEALTQSLLEADVTALPIARSAQEGERFEKKNRERTARLSRRNTEIKQECARLLNQTPPPRKGAVYRLLGRRYNLHCESIRKLIEKK